MSDEINPSAGDLEILNSEEKAGEESKVPPPDEREEETSETESDSEESEETPAELPEESEEESEEVEEEEFSEDEKEDTPKALRFGEIKKEYPDLFKKYPELRASYFKAEQYGEVFPTVDSAKEASAKADVFDQFSNQAANGDIGEILATVGNNNPNALSSIAEKVLPQLYSLNPQLYLRALNPEIKRVLQTAYRTASQFRDKESRENLQNSVAHLAQFLGLDKGQPQNAPQPDPEKEELRNRIVQNYNKELEGFNNSVWDSGYNEVSKLVKAGINPKDFNSWQTSKLTDDIIEEMHAVLKRDGKYQRELQYLYSQAERNGLSEDSKASIISAYLARAKMIIPQIRQRVLSQATGKGPELRKKVNVGQGSAPGRTTTRVPTRKEIREKGMSDLDIINY